MAEWCPSLLQVLLPATTAGVSAAIILCWTIRRTAKSRRERGYERLPAYNNTTTNGALGGAIDGAETDDDDDEFAEHLSLRRTISRTPMDHHIQADKPRAEFVAMILELVCIVGIIAAQLVGFTNAPNSNWTTLVPAAVWAYTQILVVIRLVYSSTDTDVSDLWDHTVWLYLFNFLFLVVPFRSQLLHGESGLPEVLMFVRFTLAFILCIIAVSVRKGGSAVVQDVVDGLEPSREPVASLFSLASFSWVDGIVWQGYWKPFVLDDIWNLRNDDIALSALTSFRQTKYAKSPSSGTSFSADSFRKTAYLGYTLVKHFQRDLIIQALWAAFASLFVFAPTLLLRVILEYIESPKDTPKNVAWLFVALLLFTDSIVAVGNGQALFIGRRICIRLRAVIIGEIYSKALRRKAAAGAEKELGETKKEGKDDEKSDGQSNAGAIITLMSVDSFKVSEVCAYLHFLVRNLSFPSRGAGTHYLYRLLPFRFRSLWRWSCCTRSWVGVRLLVSA